MKGVRLHMEQIQQTLGEMCFLDVQRAMAQARPRCGCGRHHSMASTVFLTGPVAGMLCHHCVETKALTGQFRILAEDFKGVRGVRMLLDAATEGTRGLHRLANDLDALGVWND